MDENNPIKYSDLISPDSSITDLIKQLDSLSDAYMNMANNIKSQAAQVAEGLRSVSGATNEGRAATKAAAADADRLIKAHRDLAFAESENAKALAALKAAQREHNQLNKLAVDRAKEEIDYNNLKAYSYKQLSAEYSVLKIALNRMTGEERENTKHGQEMVKQANALYEEMKRLQEVTGKHQLNVGNYPEARKELMELTNAIAGLTVQYRSMSEEERNSAQGQELFAKIQQQTQEAGQLKDAVMDVRQAISARASDTMMFDQITDGLRTMASAYGVAKGAMQIFGIESEEAEEAQAKLQAVMVITNAATQIQNALQKQSALMIGVTNVQLKAQAIGENLVTAAKGKGVIATKAATVAQGVFNAVAKANPYILLATGLAAVATALFAFTNNSRRAKEAQEEVARAIDGTRQAIERANNTSDFNIRMAEAAGVATAEILKMKQAQAQANVETARARLLATKAAFDMGKATQEQVDQAYTLLNEMTAAREQARQNIQVNAKREETEAKRAASERAKQRAQEAASIANQRAQERKQAAQQAEQERKQRYDNAKSYAEIDMEVLQSRRETLAAQLALAKEGSDEQLTLVREEAEAEYRVRVAEAWNAYNEAGQAYKESLDVGKINTEQYNAAIMQLTEQRTAAVAEAEKNMYDKISNFENKRIEDGMKRAKDEQQRRKGVYDAQLADFDLQQDLAKSEFDLLKKTEGEKTRFRLQQEKERLAKILELTQQNGIAMSDTEVAIIKNTMARLEQEIGESEEKDKENRDIFSRLGLNLDDKQKQAISEGMQFAKEQLAEYTQARIEAAQAAVEEANKEVEAAQRALDAEKEARANGYANNVETAQKELDLAKKNQEKALKEEEKAKKAQLAMQSIEQAGNLITASSKIWSQLGIWALPMIAVMWASFAASKLKAAQVTKVHTYGDGGVELLQGGSHQSGNDVEFGHRADGTPRRAEGGEFFAVINKRNSRKYRGIFPDVIKSFNDGTFAQKYHNAYNTDGLTLNISGKSPDLRDLSADVRAIKEQGTRRAYADGHGNMIIQYKNLTRRVAR